jgi:hypothetical protein
MIFYSKKSSKVSNGLLILGHTTHTGPYKMHKSIIFINFISRSKKLKLKMLNCV